MNNEEKILEILGNMQSDISELRQSQAVLEREVRDIKSDQQVINISLTKLDRNQAVIQQGQAALKESLQVVRESQIKVELEQFPKIAAALDGHKLNSEKLDAIQKNLEDMTPTVQALEILHQTGYAK